MKLILKRQRTVQGRLKDLARYLRHPTPALERFRRYKEAQLRASHKAQRDPATGQPWAALAASTRRDRDSNAPILGSIPDSLYSVVTGGNTIEFGLSHPLANLHHVGAKIRPHRIVPQRAEALYWVGAPHPVAEVEHPGAVIPSRPLLGYNSQDIEVLEEIIGEDAVRLFYTP